MNMQETKEDKILAVLGAWVNGELTTFEADIYLMMIESGEEE